MKNSKSAELSLDNLIATILSLSIAQAFFANILSIDLYLTPALLLFLAVKALKSKTRLPKDAATPLFLASWILFFTITIFITSNRSLPQEFVYQLFSAISFFVFIAYFSNQKVAPLETQTFKKTKIVILIYFSASLLIHIALWDQIASIFYKKENDFGGLLMDGRIRRMYGVLFNPLASAFSALMLSIILYLLNCKDKIIYIVLFLIVLLALSRSTILITILWLAYVFTLRHNKIYLIPIAASLLVASPFFFSDIYSWLVNHAMADDTGSIAEHIRNYQIGLDHTLSLYGEGFRDARELGAWNIRLESMPLQYALTGGVGLFIPISLLLIISTKRLLKRFGNAKAASALFTFPIVISFPLHTFNLPIILFSMLMCLWAIRYKPNSSISPARA